MRRGLASLIMGLSLLVATASWAGFIMSRTVLDPGRSERLADTLLDNTEVRGAIVDRLADSVEAQIPADVPISRDVIEQAADTALEDPRVEALIRDGIVQAHQNALAGDDTPVMVDAAALGAAGRDAVVARAPELDAVLPPAPSVEVELPSTGLAWLGTVKRYVDRFTLIGAIVALVGVTTAFVLARNRAAALRRIAFWAIGASAFWIATAYALPWVLERVAPSSVSIASAAIDVFFGAMIVPATILAGAGVGLLLLSFAWPAIERRRPAARLDRAAAGARAGDGAWSGATVAAPASIAAQPGIDPNRRVPPQPPAQSGVPEWVPVSAQGGRAVANEPVAFAEHPGYGGVEYERDHQPPPAPPQVDATRPFPQVWSNVGGSVQPPGTAQPTPPADPYADPYGEQPTHRAADRHAQPRADPYADPYGEQPTQLDADPYAEQPTQLAADRYAQPPTQHVGDHDAQPPTQLVGNEHRPAQLPGHNAGPQAGGATVPAVPSPEPPWSDQPVAAPPTQVAPPRPPDPDAPHRPDGHAEPPQFDVDPEQAAAADDFGAEWVEGVGYVEGDAGR